MTAKFLIDTGEWINFFNKKEEAINLISKLREKGEIFSSILTIIELRAGWTDDSANEFLPIFYAHTKIIGLSQRVAELAGKFLKDYKTKGISLTTVDTLIASTAIVEDCQLVTRNKKDFPMKELKLYQMPKIQD